MQKGQEMGKKRGPRPLLYAPSVGQQSEYANMVLKQVRRLSCSFVAFFFLDNTTEEASFHLLWKMMQVRSTKWSQNSPTLCVLAQVDFFFSNETQEHCYTWYCFNSINGVRCWRLSLWLQVYGLNSTIGSVARAQAFDSRVSY